ncbi:activity-regulated cytoskeleton associated protein 2-like isoform X2 [Lasioglossum baleicum]|uniref:activity-regulated cytoskeleton associated protein 2-like isoform X2 n=1 Tax=Lasioglossum baleicum TaxID=434251 RepID=UPI003FCD7AF4
MGVSWVYRLRKEQLIQELHAHGIGTEGTVVQMRQRLVAYVRRNLEIFSEKPEDDPDYKEEADVTKDLLDFHDELAAGLFNSSTSTPLRNNQTARNVPELAAAPPAVNTVIDQMRKWNCHFDGRDPHGILERVNELQRAYHLSDRHILEGFPELLRGDAQLWYRCVAPSVTSWIGLQEQLREYYLPPGERRHLDRQIADRRQGPNEKILPYVTAMTTLIRRRGGYSLEQELDAVYYNMRGESQLRIRRDEIKGVAQLIQRVGEIEEILMTMKKEANSWRTEGARSSYAKQEATHRTATAVTTPYSRTTHCWKSTGS